MEYGIILAAFVLIWFVGFVTGVKVGGDLMLAKLKAFTKTRGMTPQQAHIESLNPNKYRKSDD